jgi:DNA-binding NarL/FixJ family response regulator
LVRILVADDQELVVKAICQLIEKSDEHWHICATAMNGQQAIDLAVKEKPDLAILDLRMPVLDGITAGKKLRALLPDMPVLIFTSVDVPRLGLIVKEAGLQGAAFKGDGNALLHEIRKALSGTRGAGSGELSLPDSDPGRERGRV